MEVKFVIVTFCRLFLKLACAAIVFALCTNQSWAETPDAKPKAQHTDHPKPDAWGNAKLSRDVVYSDLGERKLHLDVAVPEGDAPRPAIVMFPGGVPMPDRRQHLYGPMQYFVRHGYVAATVEYRGAAEGRFPAAVDDAKNAVRFLRRHAADYRVDAKHVGAWGMSMGGGVALMLAVTDDDFGTSKKGPNGGFSGQVEAVVDRYGPSDLTTIPIDPPRALFMVWSLGTADPKSPAMREASPLSHVSKNTAPVLAEHSRKDQIVPFSQSEVFCAAMRKAGATTELHEIPVPGHTGEFWNNTPENRAAGEECLKAEAAWFDRFLKERK